MKKIQLCMVLIICTGTLIFSTSHTSKDSTENYLYVLPKNVIKMENEESGRTYRSYYGYHPDSTQKKNNTQKFSGNSPGTGLLKEKIVRDSVILVKPAKQIGEE